MHQPSQAHMSRARLAQELDQPLVQQEGTRPQIRALHSASSQPAVSGCAWQQVPAHPHWAAQEAPASSAHSGVHGSVQHVGITAHTHASQSGFSQPGLGLPWQHGPLHPQSAVHSVAATSAQSGVHAPAQQATLPCSRQTHSSQAVPSQPGPSCAPQQGPAQSHSAAQAEAASATHSAVQAAPGAQHAGRAAQTQASQPGRAQPRPSCSSQHGPSHGHEAAHSSRAVAEHEASQPSVQQPVCPWSTHTHVSQDGTSQPGAAWSSQQGPAQPHWAPHFVAA
jgi:hypothetical protein